MNSSESTTDRPPLIAATPGPWTMVQGRCEAGTLQAWWDVDGAPEPLVHGTDVGPLFPQGVCMVYGHGGAAAANARLIAAAPDLLAACRAAQQAWGAIEAVWRAFEDGATKSFMEDMRQALQQCPESLRAAIAKAEGGAR